MDKCLPTAPLTSKNQYNHNANIKAPYIVNPHQFDQDIDKFATQVHTVIQELHPTFLKNYNVTYNHNYNTYTPITIKPNELQIQKLSGGLSNFLFTVCNIHNDEDQILLFRIYTTATDSSDDDNDDNSNTTTIPTNDNGNHKISIVNHDIENKISAWLSKESVGPTYYGQFINGRVEEFYKGYLPLSYTSMSTYTNRIAYQMSKLHSLIVPDGILKYTSEDVLKVNQSIASSSSSYSNNSGLNVGGEICERIDWWLQIIHQERIKLQQSSSSSSSLNNSHHHTNRRLQETDITCMDAMINEIKKEWSLLKDKLFNRSITTTLSNNCSCGAVHDLNLTNLTILYLKEIVFTHMDLQSLNILHKPSTTNSSSSLSEKEQNANVRLIDFEYAGYNNRVCDIANTFLEYCDMNNLKPRYEIEYPSIQDQNLFLKTYLETSALLSSSSLDGNSNNNSSKLLLQCLEQHVDGIEKGWEEFLCIARRQVGKYTLVSHLGWAVWAVVQSLISDIEFDYLKYGQLRMEGYALFKSKYW